MVEEKDSEYKRIIRQRVKNVSLVVLIFIVIATPAFIWFSISTEAHLALREAKNIKLATNMLAVEYYGSGQTIYDPSKPDGMVNRVRERLLEVTQSRGRIRLLGYDKDRREVTAFTYEVGHIKITYSRVTGGDEHWIVDYIIHYAEYDSHIEEVRY